MIGLHHFDLDGRCSMAIIKYMYPGATCYEINYGDEIPWDQIKDNNVFIVDFSLELEDMKRVLKEAKNLVWIDHHVSAINNLKSISDNISGIRDIEGTYSGCELTWKYMFPDDPMPRVVKLLGRYDVHNYADPTVLPFQYAMRSKETNPKDNMNLWVNLFNNNDDREFEFLQEENLIDQIIEEGRPIEQYVENRNLEFVKNNAVCVHLAGYKFLAVNTYLENSNALERVFEAKKWDAMMVFYRKSGGWSVSMYNGDKASAVDCSEVAKKYGGGGHFDSAGFFCEKLPFEV